MFLAILLSLGAAAPEPSFDCSKRTTVIEHTICDSPELSAADATMATLYTAAKTSAFGHGASSQAAAQVRWLKERDRCSEPDRFVYKSRAECLTSYYKDRNQELAVATLFT